MGSSLVQFLLEQYEQYFLVFNERVFSICALPGTVDFSVE